MYNLSLIDTHCDTVTNICNKKEGFWNNSAHISLEKLGAYKNYAQFFAIFTSTHLTDDEGYDYFLSVSDYFNSEIQKNQSRIAKIDSFDDLNNAFADNKTGALLAVEDARILGGKIERLDEMKRRGVKYLTLMWGGKTCIGSSHDSLGGLADFGVEVVKKCFALGIIPDVSHSNEQTTSEIIALAKEYGKPVIASHSNSFKQYPHSRNLRENHLKDIILLGGLVGISLCPMHLCEKDADIDDVIAHIDSYMSLGAQDILGLGCDLDGTDLPLGFSGIESLYLIAERLAAKGYSDEQIEKIFYKNHLSFIEKNI